MSQKLVVLLFFALGVVLACQQPKDKNNQGDSLNESPVFAGFSEEAILINYDDGETLYGDSLINLYIGNTIKPLISSRETVFEVLANQDRQIDYEMMSFRNLDKQAYQSMIIWQNIEGERQKVLEFLAKTNPTDRSILTEIDSARANWIRLCNSHDVDQLVKKLYANPPMYYNHKPMVTHSDSLIQEYGYMKRDNYQLTLIPLHLSPVSDWLVYEIGQCRGSYGGKYILVWQKNEDGDWQVFFDSNI